MAGEWIRGIGGKEREVYREGLLEISIDEEMNEARIRGVSKGERKREKIR